MPLRHAPLNGMPTISRRPVDSGDHAGLSSMSHSCTPLCMGLATMANRDWIRYIQNRERSSMNVTAHANFESRIFLLDLSGIRDYAWSGSIYFEPLQA